LLRGLSAKSTRHTKWPPIGSCPDQALGHAIRSHCARELKPDELHWVFTGSPLPKTCLRVINSEYDNQKDSAVQQQRKCKCGRPPGRLWSIDGKKRYQSRPLL
jgi:hypothetical protein